MADITISDLPTKTHLMDADMVVIDDGAQTYKMYYAQFKNLFRQAFAELFVDVTGDTMTGALVMDGAKVLHRQNGQDFPVLDSSTPHVVQAYRNETSWVRIWSDGWCEQGGLVQAIAGSGGTPISFLQPMADTNYAVFAGVANANTQATSRCSCYNKTPNGFTIDWTDARHTDGTWWEVKGYKAS